MEILTSDYRTILELLKNQIAKYQDISSSAPYGLIGAVVGIHGIVHNDETVYFVPYHQWHHKNLKEDLESAPGINIYIENNANLCSFAERVFKHHHSVNLLSVSLYSGIGLGIMVKGGLLKGYHGYAGEIGHMIVVPDGEPCSCGNLGCWEQYASENSFVMQLSKKKNIAGLRYEDIINLLADDEPITCEQMDYYIKHLSIGLNNIINLYNPEILVLNSELLRLYPNALEKIKAHITSTVGHYSELLISEFGKNACSMGACALAIKNFLDISDLRLSISDSQKETVTHV